MKTEILEKIRNCTECELSKLKINEWRPIDVPNFDRRKFFCIAQNPSYYRKGSDTQVFSTSSMNDQMFLRAIDEIGIGRCNCYVTNIVKCSTENNKDPSVYISFCLPHLKREFNYVNPDVVILIGKITRDYFNVKCKNKIIPTFFFGKFIILYAVSHPSYYVRRGCDYKEYMKEFEELKKYLDKNEAQN